MSDPTPSFEEVPYHPSPRSFGKVTEQLHELYKANYEGKSAVLATARGNIYSEAAKNQAVRQAEKRTIASVLEAVHCDRGKTCSAHQSHDAHNFLHIAQDALTAEQSPSPQQSVPPQSARKS